MLARVRDSVLAKRGACEVRRRERRDGGVRARRVLGTGRVERLVVGRRVVQGGVVEGRGVHRRERGRRRRMGWCGRCVW